MSRDCFWRESYWGHFGQLLVIFFFFCLFLVTVHKSLRKITCSNFLLIFILSMAASTIFCLTDPVFVSTCSVTLTQHILFLTGSFRASSRGSCPCRVFGAPAQIWWTWPVWGRISSPGSLWRWWLPWWQAGLQWGYFGQTEAWVQAAWC